MHQFASRRMLEFQKIGVERLATEPAHNVCGFGRQEVGLREIGRSVFAVADHRMADMGQMHPDLMGSSGLQPAFHKGGVRFRIFAETFDDPVMRDGMTAVGGFPAFDLAFCTVASRASQRRIDNAFQWRRGSPDIRQVCAFKRAAASMIGKLFRQVTMRCVVLGNHHDAARVLVETMHDAWSAYAADARKGLAAMMDERIDERSRSVSGARVNDKAGGLRNDDNIVVLVKDINGNGFRRRGGLFRLRHMNLDDVARLYSMLRLCHRRAADPDCAFKDQRLDSTARQIAVDGRGKPRVEASRSIFIRCQHFHPGAGLGKGFFHSRCRIQNEAIMSETHPDEQDEKPLDPEMEKVRRKMVRLLGISIGIMFVGLMAVLAGVVYKIMSADQGVMVTSASDLQIPAEGRLEAEADLPDGFDVAQVSMNGGLLLFYGQSAQGTSQVLLYDIGHARIVAVIDLK